MTGSVNDDFYIIFTLELLKVNSDTKLHVISLAVRSACCYLKQLEKLLHFCCLASVFWQNNNNKKEVVVHLFLSKIWIHGIKRGERFYSLVTFGQGQGMWWQAITAVFHLIGRQGQRAMWLEADLLWRKTDSTERPLKTLPCCDWMLYSHINQSSMEPCCVPIMTSAETMANAQQWQRSSYRSETGVIKALIHLCLSPAECDWTCSSVGFLFSCISVVCSPCLM